MGVPENRFEEIHDAKKLYYEENLKYRWRKKVLYWHFIIRGIRFIEDYDIK